MKWVIDKQHQGMNIREYLQEIHRFSRRLLITVKSVDGGIQVNGEQQTVRFKLSEGDNLEIHFPDEKISSSLQPEKMDLTIVYEDEAIIVVNKPPGMTTLPSFNHPTGTLANGLLAHYEANVNMSTTVHVVTRLDRDTSGLVLIAKSSYIHSLLSVSQKMDTIERKYLAVIEGALNEEAGLIDKPIGRKQGSIIERKVNVSGKRAVTHFRLLSRFDHHSLVEIELETGRTHQIRVHFSHLGHPLAGDTLYGGSRDIIDRQALHCSKLRFEHPLTKQFIQFEAGLPKDIARFYTQIT